MTALNVSSADLAASDLLYLFADRVIAPPTRWGSRSATIVPCRGTRVRAEELASTLLALSLWSLEDREAIKLVSMDRKGLTARAFRARGRADLQTTIGIAVRTPLTIKGLEDGLLHATKGALPEENSIDDVVRRLLPSRLGDPYRKVIAAEERHLVGLGFLLDVGDAPRTITAIRPKRRFTPVCHEIAAVESAFSPMWSRWEALEHVTPGRRSQLIRECRRALETRLIDFY